jgi:hypothetical protein
MRRTSRVGFAAALPVAVPVGDCSIGRFPPLRRELRVRARDLFAARNFAAWHALTPLRAVLVKPALVPTGLC